MALTLTSAIGPTDRTIAITGTVPDSIAAGYEFRIDDERFVLTTFALEEVAYPGWTQMDPDRNSWIVRRGVAVAHDADSAIKGAVDAFVSAATEVPPTPFASSGGSGGVTVDNQSDPPAEVSTIVAPGADVSTPGEAALTAKDFYAQDTDPGAVGGGSVWYDTLNVFLYTRNSGNDEWLATFDMLTYDPGSNRAGLPRSAVSTDGTADLADYAEALGTGGATVLSSAVTLTGAAGSGIKSIRGGVEASLVILISDAGVITHKLLGLPSADPEVAGQLYTDGAPAPGVGAALMVSGGPP